MTSTRFIPGQSYRVMGGRVERSLIVLSRHDPTPIRPHGHIWVQEGHQSAPMRLKFKKVTTTGFDGTIATSEMCDRPFIHSSFGGSHD